MTEPLNWNPQPQTARFLHDQLDRLVQASPFIGALQQRLLSDCGTRLFDWIARLTLPASDENEQQLRGIGYQPSEDDGLWRHAAGLFPEVELSPQPAQRLFLKVESVADFVLAQGLTRRVEIEGGPLAPQRQALVADEQGVQCLVIERHGGEAVAAERVLRHGEAFRLRKRNFEQDDAGFAHARDLIRASIDELGVDRSCELFFQAEREYWQMRNHAARVQKARQDALGMGWANHDHHTYRSSRQHFASLIATLEELGLQCRERFYAGKEAGWGAQVLEQSNVGIVIFADVDLSPEEVTGDFAHQPLPPRDRLGTVGLWCALHGEAFLQAGMHHLECQFDFDAAREQLRQLGVASMKPFTDWDYLKQAFTVGEIWAVDAARIKQLEEQRLITAEQAATFRRDGALGSHLEILQRDDGYKGFNQSGINEIIRDTDPRASRAQRNEQAVARE